MIKIENAEVVGWEHAIRGMRNPKNSWDRSDSGYGCKSGVKSGLCEKYGDCFEGCPLLESDEDDFILGPNDHKLSMSLSSAGPVHAKYRRMVTVYLDITAPLYWWKEFDTYKVGTVANSCSTIHKIHDKEFTLEDFSHEHLVNLVPGHEYKTCSNSLSLLEDTIKHLNFWRSKFLGMPEEGGYNGMTRKDVWWQMIQLLPSSYNQKRTIMLNYEVLANIYEWRKEHKLDEWREFCKWIESLPYSEIITNENKAWVGDH